MSWKSGQSTGTKRADDDESYLDTKITETDHTFSLLVMYDLRSIVFSDWALFRRLLGLFEWIYAEDVATRNTEVS